MSSRPTIAIAEDNQMYREALCLVLDARNFPVIIEAASAIDLLSQIAKPEPDVFILDYKMPQMDGIEAARRIVEQIPTAGILIVTGYPRAELIEQLLHMRPFGVGLLPKDDVTADNLESAVLDVARGGIAIAPSMRDEMAAYERRNRIAQELNPRQIQILNLLVQGASNRQIADELTISLPTVERHLSAIFSKLLPDGRTSDNRRVLAVLEWLRATNSARNNT